MKPYYEHAGITIYHGDCREIVPSLTFDVIVTDPPYGIGWEGSSTMGMAACAPSIVGDENTNLRDWLRTTFPSTPTLMFGSNRIAPPVGTVATLVFAKPINGGGRIGVFLPWVRDWEPIFVCGDWPKTIPGKSSIVETAERAIAGYSGYVTRAQHPHAKPVDVLLSLLADVPPGVVLDPFMGSGTTLRAAKDLGRRAIGIEIEERYCEIAARRLAQEVMFPEATA